MQAFPCQPCSTFSEMIASISAMFVVEQTNQPLRVFVYLSVKSFFNVIDYHLFFSPSPSARRCSMQFLYSIFSKCMHLAPRTSHTSSTFTVLTEASGWVMGLTRTSKVPSWAPHQFLVLSFLLELTSLESWLLRHL